MGYIYRGAELTITAPIASSVHPGFLIPVHRTDLIELPYIDEHGTGHVMSAGRNTPGPWVDRGLESDPQNITTLL